ncbi:MAG: hypothetical protein FWD23_16640 [Oscillospiraceae bacterium]|nr:hypothetical protein [Oscillospiraceae bacterium]
MEKTNLLVLEFTVDGQKIYYDEKNKTVADSKQYLCAVFNFSGEWQNPKFALFSSGKKSKVPIAVKLDENDGCYVPHEVIKSPGFYVSAYCADDEKLITADKRWVNVSPSGYSGKITQIIPEEPEEPELPGGEYNLNEILQEAENVNRYLYTAVTIQVFDNAYNAAIESLEQPETIQQQACANLREAIDELIGATFVWNPGNIVMTIGNGKNNYQLAQYVNYDGIGTVTGTSSNEACVEIINNGTAAHPLKSGSITLKLSAPYFSDLSKSVTVTN